MPSQFFGLTIASSGLSAYQAALNTTANNISNEQTKGYSRQAANLSASDALRVNAKYGSMGSGITVNSIKQIRVSTMIQNTGRIRQALVCMRRN